MNHALGTAAIVASLALAGWGVLAGALDRAPDRWHLSLAAITEAALVALVVAALVAIGHGARPAEGPVWIGYVITTLAMPLTGVVLARMEPTRWGSVTIGVVGLIVPVLVLRLYQVWEVASIG